MDRFYFEEKDFLNNPNLVREYALTREFDTNTSNKSIWSGFRYKIPIEDAEELTLKIQDHFDKKITLNSVYFHMNPKVSMHGFPDKDSNNTNEFAGVIYLNDLTDKNAGTTLYEDYDQYQYDDYLHKMQIVYSTSVPEDNIFKRRFSEECLNFKKNNLKQIVSFDFEFNKMVCYSANYLHSSNFYFGDSKRTNRLTISFSGEIDAN